MCYRILVFGFLLGVFSCTSSNDNLPNERIVEGYISALNKADINEISNYISDTVKVEELEYLLSDNVDDFRRMFQWDSVFNPHFELIDFQELDQGVQITLSKQCNRILFLLDTALITKSKFEFSEGKITRIQTYDFLNMDFDKWEARRDTLISWINIHHPNLNGFAITQTIQGGQNYLKAIELYRSRY